MFQIGILTPVLYLFQFGRWSALLLGIMWGSHRYNTLKASETAWRVEEAERKIVKEAHKATEKTRLNREELLYLADQAGVKVPPNF
jgi:F-type H+-transporting ATPase subunit e